MKSPFLQFRDPAEICFERRYVVALAHDHKATFLLPAARYFGPLIQREEFRFRSRNSPHRAACPKAVGLVGRSINFKSVFACVARSRDDRVDAINISDREMVILDLVEIGVGKLFENDLCQRSLNRDLAIVGARVGQT